jgi:putative spermidine/putrescine transport system ATP-binding protein
VTGVNDPAIRLSGLRKTFATRDRRGERSVHAVDGVDLEVREGEFFSMLGPSGSGKTTVLRLIAGFEVPTAGRIELAGADVTRLAPFQRDVNTVFQDYALFPHLNVRDNIAYGLRVKGVARRVRHERAAEALASVRLADYGDRKPSQLSGGQRQRVALARALVNRPRVLLLDEPLGALDLKLREEMQVELKGIQRQVGITFVFVTHDQEEALTMSDRIAVFNQGRIEQVATPAELYERPATAFVAGFVGTSNLFTGESARTLLGRTGTFAVRPERLRLADDGPAAGEASATGKIAEIVYAGPVTRFLVDLDAGPRVVAARQNQLSAAADDHAMRGAAVTLAWRPEHVIEIPGRAEPIDPTSPDPLEH